MKKRIFLIALAVLLAVGILCLTTCDSRIPGATPGTALTAPQLRLEEDLSLAWEPVEGATEYLIYVNGSALSTTANVTWPALAAPGTYSIQVQAVKGEEKGPASQAVSYTVYGVSLPVSELFTVVGGQSVGQGQDYSFTVSYVEGCENSTPVVKINGQEATPDKDGVYSVSDVSGDLTVTIEGVALNSYTVTLPKGKGYTVKGEETALYGKDYNLNFAAGEMTVSAPKAYKSMETLSWTKIGAGKPSNVYFAMEDGYYVLETITAQGVTSPTEWLEKYCVADDAGQRTWRVYTDYINKGGNSRSLLWGWGSAVDIVAPTADGGWAWKNGMQTDGYTDGEVFSLHTDTSGTARFKILDWVSNRNEWNAALKLDYVDEQTVIWSAADSYKLRLASTQEIIQAGYNTLQVTLTGDLGNALVWYGEDDWADGEIAVGADKFVNGSYTFEADLTEFKSTENFTLMASAAAFTDLKVHIEPVKKAAPATYSVTLPTGEGYTASGEATVKQGENYTFTVALEEGYTQSELLVKANDTVLTGENGTYTVSNVQGDLVITVEGVQKNTYTVTKPTGQGFQFQGEGSVEHGKTYTFTVTPDDSKATVEVKVNGKVITGENGSYSIADVKEALTVTAAPERTLVEKLLNGENWNGTGTEAASSLTLSANASLKGDYLKSLWDAGYTHLVFTVTAESATNYTHGGDWERYWRGLNSGENTIRIDINEFHDGDTWYNLNFAAGEMTVSAPKAYKSKETLSWTKIGAGKPSNVYFAMENGYYVLETITAQGVTSPTEWLKKYVVTDDAGQRSWRVYTDYINKGGNTRSLLWGWGSAVDVVAGTAAGGWVWKNAMQTDGYAVGEVFSLHTDVGGTARFKILDWVSNRNGDNAALKLDYVDDKTVIWSGGDGYKLRLATTQDLIAKGYNSLQVTLTGDLGNAVIWYGEDDWSDGEIGVGADKFVDGSYSFEVDLTEFKANENFTMMGNAASFSDLKVHVKPVKKAAPAAYSVSLPTGEGYTVTGEATATEGQSYSFTVIPTFGYTVTVKVNGVELTGSGNRYTVENVTSDLQITVTAKENNDLTLPDTDF